ncbi:hypothetical protein [Frankia sp. AgKG'84/4]|uniref:hypothetical protein n=1 Tax=Frankia sp. AgKG'84/4 TaxID=573490 RepID=UPI00200D73FB|nr:hypothetical protein [Frankia sp. AgKG'84/4]MCL9797302.1 hypothetical protein [Frankia sp. AgKG'84/4]
MSLLGWRQWAVDREGRLRPAWTPWTPFPPGMLLWRPDGITQAHCLRTARPDPGAPSGPPTASHDRVPGEHCLCGLYAWRTPEILAAAKLPRWSSLPCVVGVVRLGGRVIIGARGYRAERGYPVALLDRDDVVASEYTVARYRTFRSLVAEWTPSATEPEADGPTTG